MRAIWAYAHRDGGHGFAFPRPDGPEHEEDRGDGGRRSGRESCIRGELAACRCGRRRPFLHPWPARRHQRGRAGALLPSPGRLDTGAPLRAPRPRTSRPPDGRHAGDGRARPLSSQPCRSDDDRRHVLRARQDSGCIHRPAHGTDDGDRAPGAISRPACRRRQPCPRRHRRPAGEPAGIRSSLRDRPRKPVPEAISHRRGPQGRFHGPPIPQGSSSSPRNRPNGPDQTSGAAGGENPSLPEDGEPTCMIPRLPVPSGGKAARLACRRRKPGSTGVGGSGGPIGYRIELPTLHSGRE
ncbi:hypothetical protein LMIY3S_00970 [Labrys miyagiensis]